MCGIAGIIKSQTSSSVIDSFQIDHMLSALSHRGPDSSEFIKASSLVTVGCARLAVTDARNPAANMPLSSSKKDAWIVLNGEIYNHLELRQELTHYEFRSGSDAETLLAAYLYWGRNCIHRLYGMFAFCIVDLTSNQCWLACDQMGQKTLYYARIDGGLVFASEIDALLCSSNRFSLDKESVAEFISRRYIVGEDTLFRDIKRLEPGTELLIGQQTVKRRYFHFEVSPEKWISTPAQALNALSTVCTDVVTQTLTCEFPMAMLLSGGVDSALICAIAQQNKIPLTAVTSGFAESVGYRNEFAEARAVASHLGIELECQQLSDERYFECLDQWTTMTADPIASYEACCLLSLFEQVGKNFRVAISGSGADELFDGYGNGAEMIARGVSATNLASNYSTNYLWLYDADPARLLPHSKVLDRLCSKFDQMLAPYRSQTDNVMVLTQLINILSRGSVYEFRQVDLTSMKASVEARSPWGDLRLAQLSMQINPELFNRAGSEKWLWKEFATRFLPQELAHRKKTAFPVPPTILITSRFEALVKPALEPGSRIEQLGLLDMDYVRERWESRRPECRTLFYRLLILERFLGKYSRCLE